MRKMFFHPDTGVPDSVCYWADQLGYTPTPDPDCRRGVVYLVDDTFPVTGES